MGIVFIVSFVLLSAHTLELRSVFFWISSFHLCLTEVDVRFALYWLACYFFFAAAVLCLTLLVFFFSCVFVIQIITNKQIHCSINFDRCAIFLAIFQENTNITVLACIFFYGFFPLFYSSAVKLGVQVDPQRTMLAFTFRCFVAIHLCAWVFTFSKFDVWLHLQHKQCNLLLELGTIFDCMLLASPGFVSFLCSS